MKKLLLTPGFVWLLLLPSFFAAAQDAVPQGWHVRDLKTEGYYGISLNKAYEFLKQKKLKSVPVIVAVIDSGIDTLHEDLKSVLWQNPKELPGNGIDDDKNGYIDDLHGWNFLGSNDGKANVEKETFEAGRVYWSLKNKYEGLTASEVPPQERFEYDTWQRARAELTKTDDSQPMRSDDILMQMEVFRRGDQTIRKDLKKEVYTCKDLAGYKANSPFADHIRTVMLAMGEEEGETLTNTAFLEEINKYFSGELDKAQSKTEPPKDYRKGVVNDNYKDINDKFYGNNNIYVTNEGAVHGTHVAGIIGAVRNNGLGIDGISDNVRIMSIRAVPDGDEYDKDIALAIRYAVDNGARVINMSFGKSYSPQKQWVDDAVKYADRKGVLMVHAAGNDAKNVDTTFNFPSPSYLDGGKPVNWITVGASGDEKAGGLTASFSNYGKKSVDVFAPGVKIYSTVPGGNTYRNLQGTSMASPVVAGLAAFIMSYYPALTATQVKNIIEKTVSKPTQKVENPGNKELVSLSELSVTGGIVNAYEAIKLASITKPLQPFVAPAKKPVAQKAPSKAKPAPKKK